MTEDRLRAYLKRVTVDLAEARRRLAEADGDRHEPIAVIGMACRYPGGVRTPEEFWTLLSEGRDTVADVPKARWDIEEYYDPERSSVGGVYTKQGAFLDDIAGFDAGFFGLSPQEAFRMDPQQRLLMELMWEGMEDAGTTPASLAGSRTGVMVGLMDTVQYGRLEMERTGPSVAADPLFGQGVSTSVAAGRLAYQYDLRGPTLTIDTACSSSLVGVHLAAEALRRGECDMAVAAGAYLVIRPDTFVQGCATSMLAVDGRCKTFDASADGYVLGEGGGLVVLERLSSALANGRRIRAIVRGSAVNQDGRSNGLTAPNRGAQVDVIRRAQAAAGVAPDEVAYVEAHGSGTKLGDAIELSALHDVFATSRDAERPLLVGAVKTNIGHTQSAAGVAGLIKTVLVLENGVAPANRNLEDPSDAIPGDGTVRPLAAAADLPAGRVVAGVSSFGWSGTNAHVVVETAPAAGEAEEGDGQGADGLAADPLPARTNGFITLPISAASTTALQERAGGLATVLTERPDVDLADIAHTLQHGRAGLDYRAGVVALDRADAIRQLTALTSGIEAKRRPKIAFLLPGTGDQYAGLGRELYSSEPVYAAAIDECLTIAEERCGVDLRPLMFSSPSTAASGDLAALLGRENTPASEPDPLAHAELSHPYLFTVEYALAKLLEAWGVRPDVLVGYSLGEYVAACLAGVLTLGDALHVVVERARLIATARAGRMLAVAADEARVRSALAESGARVDVAALTGPTMTVVSGTEDQVDVLAEALRGAGVACRPLRSEHAFHSSLLAPVRDKLAALLDSVPRAVPTTTIVSNTTGSALTAEQAASGEYWGDHLVSPIRFADSVRYCVEQGVDVFIELGAGATLGGLVRQNLAGAGGAAVVGTLPAAWSGTAGAPDVRLDMAGTRARLWEQGLPVVWPEGGRTVSLPPYPFQRTAFWPEQNPDALATDRSRPSRPTDLAYVPAWRRDVTGSAPNALPLDGPLVIFAADEGLADLAEAAGVPVIEVIPGTELKREGRRLTIDIATPEHYREAFTGLPADGPLHVVHAWSTRTTAADDAALRHSIKLGFDSLLLTVQALGALPTPRPIHLLTVSRNALDVHGGDATAPHQAAVHGLGRVVHHEIKTLTWHGIDLDDAHGPVDLVAELLTPDPEPTLAARRRGRRWTQDWAELPISESATAAGSARTSGATALATPAGSAGTSAATASPAGSAGISGATATETAAGSAGASAVTVSPAGSARTSGATATETVAGSAKTSAATAPAAGAADTLHRAATPWRPEGTYLITGGTRGLGLTLAHHLVRAGVRRLALVGRSRPDRTAPGIAALEAVGAEVLLLAADAGVPDALRAALTETRRHFGALTGVIHAAGLPAGGMAQRRAVADAESVLAPKILAMGPLAELVGPATPEAERPELLVLYSSAVTVFGGIGEGDYCAANTVLDAYAAALAADAPTTRIVSVAWGPWLHDAWQSAAPASGLADRAAAYRRRYGFSDDAGCALLDRILLSDAGIGSVIAVRQRLEDSRREWAAMVDLDSLVDASAVAPATERFPRPQLRTEYVAPRSERERAVAEIWQAYLGIERVGVHDPFFDLGGNSLVGMAMVLAVEKELGLAIAPALLFEHPTVAAFSAALDPAGGKAAARELIATSSARGHRRRRARMGND
ncbi:Beta-ketoacyl synthase [Catenulispora acidiphila DSM 44928]|uniref:Beta-ketoacyl synthase n=1 Tax=Catenulispora acidiphila (strain DSM 44928 / JCM 14897 / NBRC 102108 / NRRL B-24433 / ID139908) TaxID=479433 RepID=C7Q562_CATAD|nr:type I polyketide synthase [Catenulispora acidiphila]ACU75831.1 Beta-ketoacyl synthase [Catenulispora acidiphila DSM 44928]